VFTKVFHEVLEVLGLSEVSVDGSETNIGDLVQLRQLIHGHLTDNLGRYLRLAQRLQAPLDTIDDTFDTIIVDRPLSQSDPQ
jgi:hypothetical protein